MDPEPSLLPNEARAAAMWRHALSLMDNGSLPSVVQQLAIEAMTLTASAWGFASQDAVEAVLMKVERQTPLTFAYPQLGIFLRSITDTLVADQSASRAGHRNVRIHCRGAKQVQYVTTGNNRMGTALPNQDRSSVLHAQPNDRGHPGWHKCRSG